jgi:hypothetical protein
MITSQKRFEGDWEVTEYARAPIPLPEGPLRPILSSFLVPELLEIDSANRPSAARFRGLVQVMNFVISKDNEAVTSGDLRSIALSITILSNRMDLVEVLLNEIPFRPTQWWSQLGPPALALALEVNPDLQIAARINVQANTGFAQAAVSASTRGFERAIRRLKEDIQFDFETCKDDQGYSCLDCAIRNCHANSAAFLYKNRCPYLPSLQADLKILLGRDGMVSPFSYHDPDQYTLHFIKFKYNRTDVFYLPKETKLHLKVKDCVIVDADYWTDLGMVHKVNVTEQEARALTAQLLRERAAAEVANRNGVNMNTVEAIAAAASGVQERHVTIPKKYIRRLAVKGEIDGVQMKMQDEAFQNHFVLKRWSSMKRWSLQSVPNKQLRHMWFLPVKG